jgi:DNA polymerase-3 subunit epsilon
MTQRQRLIYYDTETTGISTERDRIIELAAYDAERQTSFVRLINPGCPIPPEATAIHKITNEMVATAQNFSEVAQEFISFCEGEVVLIAHNNDSFDLPFLQNEFKRHKLPFPSWIFIDSLKWARRYRCDLPRHSLQFLREVYGIKANNAHRALDDVVILHQIFSLMIDDLPVDQVIALLNRRQELLHMPFGKYQGKPLASLPRDYVQWLASNGALNKSDNQELRASLEKLGLLKSK